MIQNNSMSTQSLESLKQESVCLSRTFKGRKVVANVTSLLCCPLTYCVICISDCCTILDSSWSPNGLICLPTLRQCCIEDRSKYRKPAPEEECELCSDLCCKFFDPVPYLGSCCRNDKDEAINYSVAPERQRMEDLTKEITKRETHLALNRALPLTDLTFKVVQFKG